MRGIDAPVGGIEAGAVGVGIRCDDRAPGVRFVGPTVGGVDLSCECTRGVALDGAAGRGVQRHLILLLHVDTLDDIDLPFRGPGASAQEPESGPGSTRRGGHVQEVEDEETFVEGLLGGDAHGWAARVDGSGGINPDVGGIGQVGDGGDELLGGGGVVGRVANEAVGWVGRGEGREVAEESVAGVVIGESVSGEG